ncbi:hypothetical protein KUTeg_015012 [Tegillarca granosa]|uniref:Uncharacterized protein n=1 Tax=Tegillarca granosa TaxID=220873 RepID=A0ABQ9EUE7_TEGGR|nr:hypothetical protein KUTeg_015012 [Tegillarca granosa]
MRESTEGTTEGDKFQSLKSAEMPCIVGLSRLPTGNTLGILGRILYRCWPAVRGGLTVKNSGICHKNSKLLTHRLMFIETQNRKSSRIGMVNIWKYLTFSKKNIQCQRYIFTIKAKYPPVRMVNEIEAVFIQSCNTRSFNSNSISMSDINLNAKNSQMDLYTETHKEFPVYMLAKLPVFIEKLFAVLASPIHEYLPHFEGGNIYTFYWAHTRLFDLVLLVSEKFFKGKKRLETAVKSNSTFPTMKNKFFWKKKKTPPPNKQKKLKKLEKKTKQIDI